MDIHWEHRPGLVVARVAGELDLDSAPRFREMVDEAILAAGADRLVLNLSRVTFIDSSGVGAILGRYRSMAAQGGRIALVAGPARVTRVLELAGVPQVMGCHRSESEAVAALEAAVPRGVQGR